MRFVAAQRGGNPGFDIRERSADGDLVPAARRAEYAAVQFQRSYEERPACVRRTTTSARSHSALRTRCGDPDPGGVQRYCVRRPKQADRLAGGRCAAARTEVSMDRACRSGSLCSACSTRSSARAARSRSFNTHKIREPLAYADRRVGDPAAATSREGLNKPSCVPTSTREPHLHNRRNPCRARVSPP